MNIVLVHSGVSDAREWDAVKPLLEADGHVVAAPTLWGAKAATLADVVLDAAPGDPVVLVGTSYGGLASLDAAIAAPQRVSHLVLIGTNPFGWSDELKPIMRKEGDLYDAGRLDEAAELMVRWWLVGPAREPDEVPVELQQRVHAMQRGAYDLGDPPDSAELDLSRLRAPLLYLYGELDWPEIVRASGRFPGAEVHELAGTAHLPTMERPDEVARLVQEFIS